MSESVFKNKNYVLLFTGSLVSNLGTVLFNFAMSLYILVITNAAVAGIYLATGGVVFFLLSPFGGAIVDRLDKVKVVYITDFINGIAILIAGVIIMGGIDKNIILVVLFSTSIILSINGALFNPAARSLPPFILEENQLQQSSSLTQGMFALYAIVGAFLGALAYNFLLIEWIFLLNGLSFILSGISEMFIDVKAKALEMIKLSFVNIIIDIKDGFKYLYNLKPVLYLVMIASLLNFFTVPVIVNGIPYLIYIVLEKDPIFLSILNTAFPIGIIITSLVLGSQAQKDKVSPLIIRGFIGMAFFFVIVVAVTQFIVLDKIDFILYIIIAVGLLILMGIFNGMLNIPFSVAVMKQVEKEKMGRVFSVITTISNGLTPIAIGIAGFVIEYIGVMVLFYAGAVAMVITAVFAAKNKYIGEL